MRHVSATLMLLFAGGCYTYVPAEVHLFEADSGRAIAGQKITPLYSRNFNLFVPDMSPARTDERGIARLRVCTNYGQGGPLLKVGESGSWGDGGPSLYLLRPSDLLRQDRRPARVEFPVQTAIE